MENIVVHDVSITSYKCEMLFNGGILSYGTCFFYKFGDKEYLISNWHNFSGRHPETGAPLSKQSAIPDEVNVMIPLKGKLGFSGWGRFRLKSEDGDDLWLEHPLKNRIDVAVLEVKVPDTLEPRYVSGIKRDPYAELLIAGDVFIVGYPLGITVAETLPLWKRASFASEPAIDVGGLPKYLVDTATREGMSGSPVFARSSYVKGSYVVTGDSYEDNRPWSLGYEYNFIGIYSGRLGNDEFQAQLGIVWKARVITEIIENRGLQPVEGA